MYEPRIYRAVMNRERFQTFVVQEKESDLWIGISPGIYPGMLENCRVWLHGLRSMILEAITRDARFAYSLEPLEEEEGEPELIREMKQAGLASGTGPMAAVAGAIAGAILKKIDATYQPKEILIENGGDIALKNNGEVLVSIFPGTDSKFRDLSIRIPEKHGILGICTSSGTFGHSLSLGKADSVSLVMHSPSLADAWATAIANLITTEDDIETALNTEIPGLLSLVCIKGEKIGIRGELAIGLPG